VKVLISAAETSSDAHAAELLHALREKLSAQGEELQAFGIGGPKLRSEGQEQLVDARELLSMGFLEIASRLPKILQSLDLIEKAALTRKPDVAVVLDYPDFHFRLARRLRRQGVPLIYYIPPKVWAWRKGRVRFLKKFFSKILCIFPFEEAFYRGENVPVKYVGNPLLDELPLRSTKAEAREKLGIQESERVLAVLAGSRPAELKRHLELFLDGAQMTAAKLFAQGVLKSGERLRVLVPFPETSRLAPLKDRVTAWEVEQRHLLVKVDVSQGDSAWLMLASDAGVIKSGTSTLESALLQCPHVIVYKPNVVTTFLVRKVIRYWGPIGLSNLVAGAKRAPFPIPEITGSDVTAHALSENLVQLFRDTDLSRQVREVCKQVREAMWIGDVSPSDLAACEVLEVARGPRGAARVTSPVNLPEKKTENSS
jgi:lipid-A-disaccharide synthase